MSTDRAKDKPVNPARPLSDIKPLTGIQPSTRMMFSTEIEISDETLEAVAGGGMVNPPVQPSSADPVDSTG